MQLVGRSGRIALMLAVAAVAAVGCTQRETPAQYEQKVSDSYQQRKALILSLSTTGKADYYLSARAAFEDDIDELGDIVPPKDVEQAHERYIASLEGMVIVLQTLADCRQLQESNFREGRNCINEIKTSDLDQIENDFREAETIFESRGYKLQGVADGTPDES